MGDLRIFDLLELKIKYNLEYFVETGTLYGDGVDYAKEYFSEIHSIEIDKELAEKAQKKYEQQKGINIHNTSSEQGLKDVCSIINNNTLFWLDAHFPGADSHKVPYDNEKDINIRLPLETELNVISQHAKKYNDLIIIDDLWLFEDGPFEWGSFDEHAKRCNMNVTRKQLINKTSDFIYPLFEKNYEFEKKYNHQGYLLIKPKKYENS